MTYAFTVITIPNWQCGPWAQYMNIGFVSFTGTLKVFTVAAPAETGMNP